MTTTTYREIVDEMASWLPPDELGLKDRAVKYVHDMLRAKRFNLDTVIVERELRGAKRRVCRLFERMMMQLRYEHYISRHTRSPRQQALEQLSKNLLYVSRFMSPLTPLARLLRALEPSEKGT